MLPNEKFALECRDRYAEDGLVVDESNGEFAHCPLPRGLGESGYYLLHDDHQHQGLLQSRDVGRKCYWIPDVKRWLTTTHFVDGYFELWDIFDEFNIATEETKGKISESKKGKPMSEEERLKRIGRTHSEETRRKMSEGQRRYRERIRREKELNQPENHEEND